MPADALATYDGGHTTFWSNDLTPVHEVRTRLHEPGMSHLGFGLPFALSLALQRWADVRQHEPLRLRCADTSRAGRRLTIRPPLFIHCLAQAP